MFPQQQQNMMSDLFIAWKSIKQMLSGHILVYSLLNTLDFLSMFLFFEDTGKVTMGHGNLDACIHLMT